MLLTFTSSHPEKPSNILHIHLNHHTLTRCTDVFQEKGSKETVLDILDVFKAKKKVD